MDDRTAKISLDYTPDEILALIGGQARTAFQAELDFFEWRADNESASFKTFMGQYMQWVASSGAYAYSYAKMANEHPQLMGKLEAIVGPIQHEIFGTE